MHKQVNFFPNEFTAAEMALYAHISRLKQDITDARQHMSEYTPDTMTYKHYAMIEANRLESLTNARMATSAFYHARTIGQ